MKNMKKLASILLALVMVLAMATTAFAVNITIEEGATGSVYSAYKLLNATDGGDGKFAYTLNEKYTSVLQSVTGKTEQADIVDYISNLDSDGIREFADDVYTAIKAMPVDATSVNNVFENVDQGYYLIAETTTGDWGDGKADDTYSLVMLDTAGNANITVETKEDVPTLDKEIIGGDTADATTAAVGDVITFQLTGTVSNKYADYVSYYYNFKDTMSAGLTYNEDAYVYVLVNDQEVELDEFTVTTNGNGFTASCENLKDVTSATINAGTEIYVKYTATINANALTGTQGNTNSATLDYTNDPYGGDGTGTTPPDTNVVFTFETIVNKTDKDGNALEGAGFTLYKWDNGTSAWVAVGDEITGVTTFDFTGLDEGKYKLVETTVPRGYNKADDVEFEIEATIENEVLTDIVVKDKNGAKMDTFTIKLDETNSSVTTAIINQSGTELPSTGGIGTTIFYVSGAVLAIAAVVFLVTKKRMSGEEE